MTWTVKLLFFLSFKRWMQSSDKIRVVLILKLIRVEWHAFYCFLLVKHVDEGVHYNCPACQRTYRSRNSFQGHIFSRHKTWKKLDISTCEVPRENQIVTEEF
jgi:hypothetical protein